MVKRDQFREYLSISEKTYQFNIIFSRNIASIPTSFNICRDWQGMAESRGNSGDRGAPKSFEVSGDESVTEAVIRAVSTTAGVDSQELPSLYHTIDPDALDSICARCHSFRFQYHGFSIAVIDGTRVELTPTEPGANQTS